MSLNSSCNNVTGTRLPVLGDPPFSQEQAEIAKAELKSVIFCFEWIDWSIETQQCRVYRPGTRGAQLASAGIRIPVDKSDEMEITVYDVEARVFGWKFRRAWYYWICTTDDRPIPEQVARKLNVEWGSQVRVDGFAGGCEPKGSVYAYHVDTLDGLKALVEAIGHVPLCPGRNDDESFAGSVR